MDSVRGFFFQNQGTFFDYHKKGRGGLPLPPSCPPLSVAEYASIFRNIPAYPWKCLKKLFWLHQDSEYNWSSYMCDRLLKMSWVLNMLGFWIGHGCIYKGYNEFWIWLNMDQYASIIPEYAIISLNMTKHGWMLLEVPEYTWNCLNKLFKLNKLIMSGFTIWLIILGIWQG